MDDETLDALWSRLNVEAEEALMAAIPRAPIVGEDAEMDVDDIVLARAILTTSTRALIDHVMERAWVPMGMLDDALARAGRPRGGGIPLGLLLQVAAVESEMLDGTEITPRHLLLSLLNFPELTSTEMLEDHAVSYWRLQRRARVSRLND